MTVTRVRRLVNPSRRPKARNKARRKLSPKQIRHFGTKAQKAALKRKRSMAAKAHRPMRRAVANPRRRARSNPAVITLGLINPTTTKRKRTKTMAATKRRRRKTVAVSNPRRRRRAANTHRPRRTNARRRNSTRVYVIKKNRRSDERTHGAAQPGDVRDEGRGGR